MELKEPRNGKTTQDPLAINNPKKKRAKKLDVQALRKYPNPKYKLPRVDYIDKQGREYMIADPLQTEKLSEVQDVWRDASKELAHPDLYQEGKSEGTVAWVRIPRHLKGEVGYPDAQGGEKLRLFHVTDNVEASATVERSMFGPRRKTGYVVLSRMKTIGQTDPSEWKHLTVKEFRNKGKRDD